MNYYPNNFYQNYSYGNQYQQQPQQVMQPAQSLQGKMVDSIEMVKVSEVPFGGFSIFPKGDLSEIYIKSWNNNGTTQINTYRPVPVEETPEVKEVNTHAEILNQIAALNQKIDALMTRGSADTQVKAQTPAPVAPKKDVDLNAY